MGSTPVVRTQISFFRVCLCHLLNNTSLLFIHVFKLATSEVFICFTRTELEAFMLIPFFLDENKSAYSKCDLFIRG